MIEWGVLRDSIRDSVLKDAAGSKFTNSQLLTWAKWALHELSFHTAELASATYDGDGEQYQFDLPLDMVDSIEKVGLVGFDDGEKTAWLPCLRQSPNSTWFVPTISTSESSLALTTSWRNQSDQSAGYWEWPQDTLVLSFIPAVDSVIRLNYFKIWDPPVDDDSWIIVPLWMEQPLVYLIAARAMDPLGFQASNIRQWDDKTVQGHPEHNPLHRQYEFFLKNAQRILSMHRVQDRENFFSAYRPRQ